MLQQMKANFLFQALPFGRTLCLFTAGILLGFGATSCDDDEVITPPVAEQNIVQVAAGNADFTVLVAAVTKADLATTLSGAGPFTVFAPNNAAFAKLAGGPLDAFSTVAKINAVTDASQIAALRGVLLYHTLGADVQAGDIAAGASTATTLRPASMSGVNDNTIYLTRTGSSVFVNGGTSVIAADITASNGTIHAIDNVLLPPSATVAGIVQASAAATPAQFTQLLRALSQPAAQALLAAAANNASNLTVFAPTDAAFQTALTALNLQNVDQIPPAMLVSILEKHIITSGRVFSSDLAPGTVAAINGNVTIAAAGNGFTVRGGSGTAANITAANTLATNGVVHAIDQVLLP